VSSLEIVKDSKLISKKGKPLIAIPTTAGTGSEATHFAVVYHDNKKYSVAHKSILPDVAILVNSLTASQPKHLTACAGLDAFSQAIESYWSVNATEESKAYAREAILLLIPNLVQAVNFPNKNNRQAVMKGAYFAGKAINISKTTAAHAVSYAFTTYYGIPHGHAVFLTLPEFFEHISNVDEKSLNDARGVNYVKNIIMELCEMFNTSSVSEARDFLRNFAEKIQIELSINKLDLLDCEDKIVENLNIQRLKNNPRSVSKLDLRAILKRKIGG
jgi:alcohol dehydrogenase class IV